jgi:hypothetical protein
MSKNGIYISIGVTLGFLAVVVIVSYNSKKKYTAPIDKQTAVESAASKIKNL